MREVTNEKTNEKKKKKKSVIEQYTCSMSIKLQLPSNCWEVGSWAIVEVDKKNYITSSDIEDNEPKIDSLITTIIALSRSATTAMLWINDYNLVIGYIKKALDRHKFHESSCEKLLRNHRIQLGYCNYEGYSLKIKTEFDDEEPHYIVVAPLVNLTRHKLSEASSAFLKGDEVVEFNKKPLLIDNIESETFQYDNNEEVAKQAFAMAYIVSALKQSKIFNINCQNLTLAKIALQQWEKFDTTGITKEIKKLEIDNENINETEMTTAEELRQAYRGGLLWLNPYYEGVDIDYGLVLDINSFYSWVMRYCELPVSRPKEDAFPNESWKYMLHYYIGGFIFKNIQLKEDGIPCLYNDADELIDGCELLCSGWYTNFDISAIMKNYNIEEKDIYCFKLYTFETRSGVFNEYIDYFYELKKNSTGTEREIVKLFLESLYGRFGVLKASRFQYLPMSVFITSIARYIIMMEANKVGIDRIVQIDTDGLHIYGLEIPEDIDIGPDLGQFKIEDVFKEARYIAKRSYCHKSVTISDRYNRNFTITGEGKTIFKLCRAQDEVKSEMTWENFRPGFESEAYKVVKVDRCGNKYRAYTKFKIRN